MSNQESNNTDLAGDRGFPAGDGSTPQFVSGMEENSGAINPLELVRDRLEGRWLYAIATALVLGIVAA